MISTIPIVDISGPSGEETEDLLFWLDQFDLYFRTFVKNLNSDLVNGTSTLPNYETMPAVKEIYEGQRFLFHTGTELRQYTNFNDVFYYSVLTKDV